MKNGVAITVFHRAKGRVAGLTDLTLKSYNPSNVLVDTVVLSELGGGYYKAVFTPNVVGAWRVAISSVANGDAAEARYDVEAYDLSDIETLLTTVDGKADLIKDTVDSIETTVEANAAAIAAVQAEVDKIQTIDDNVDSVKGTVEATSTAVGTVKADTESLIAKVDAVKGVVDTINVETDETGRIF